ncbi:MAG: hypothetical protein V8T86_13290 [Victivallis sp.]
MHRIELHLNPDRERDPFPAPPVVNSVVTRGFGAPETRRDVFTWVSPDRLEVNLPLEGTRFSSVPSSGTAGGRNLWPGRGALFAGVPPGRGRSFRCGYRGAGRFDRRP